MFKTIILASAVAMCSAQSTKNIVELAASVPDLSTLVTAVKAAGLVDTLYVNTLPWPHSHHLLFFCVSITCTSHAIEVTVVSLAHYCFNWFDFTFAFIHHTHTLSLSTNMSLFTAHLTMLNPMKWCSHHRPRSSTAWTCSFQ